MNAAPNERAAIEVLRNEPLRKHTSWRVGGPADLFYTPTSTAELQRILADLPPATPVHWLGLGSNLLVRDGGIRGAVIATGSLPRELERLDSHKVRASAGLACMLLAKRCVRWQLGPAAFFAGIPGTVGGALAMNAGAFGGETWAHVAAVTTIDRRGELHERARAEFEIDYRSVRGPANEWFLAATFRFDHDASSSMEAIKELLARRNAAQPLGIPSCGSVFRNPPGDFAGRLIEQAGLKGKQLGGARVSDKHANFILNAKNATAADIEALIHEVRAAVERTSGVQLELEVRVIGEPGVATPKGEP
ncbi:MAG TPA: UDP-N-acetylmuramate dehydrogenase [Gammaproteobacteria bacterium]|nr:UDP-N-acetylmuramate dehydrogenase [Gammaproteobacteria bacterium]